MSPCPKCRGKGTVDTYLGPMSDHDAVSFRCSECGGTGRAQARPTARDILDSFDDHARAHGADPDADLLTALRARSGDAYSRGDDERALRLRRAADALTVQLDLRNLDAVTGGTAR